MTCSTVLYPNGKMNYAPGVLIIPRFRRTPLISQRITSVRAGLPTARRSEEKIPVFCPGRFLTERSQVYQFLILSVLAEVSARVQRGR